MRRFGLIDIGRLVLVGAFLMAPNAACFAQLDIFLTASVTETPEGLFKYEYLLENLPGSSVSVNNFLLDVGENARITDMTGPLGWDHDYNPDERDLQVAWLTDPAVEDFDVKPGATAVFSLLSPLEPEPSEYFVGKLLPDLINLGGFAAGMIDGPRRFVEPEADCNGDGVVDIEDANCTPDELLDDFLAALDPPSLRGDMDGDGQVQFTDLVALSTNFGSPGEYTDADFDKDGVVQFGDLVILSERFGQSGAAGATAVAVPEPAAIPSLVIGAICLAGLVRRRAIR